MTSKREENINKLIKRGLMSPHAFAKKRYRVTYADGTQEDDIRTSQTVRKRADNYAVVSVEMQKMKIDKASLKVADESEWKDVSTHYITVRRVLKPLG